MSSLDSAEVSANVNVEKLVEHFDRTDAADMSWEVATDAQIERPEMEQIFVRLPKEDVAVLRQRAARLGIGYTTLIRLVLREYLRNPLSR